MIVSVSWSSCKLQTSFDNFYFHF